MLALIGGVPPPPPSMPPPPPSPAEILFAPEIPVAAIVAILKPALTLDIAFIAFNCKSPAVPPVAALAGLSAAIAAFADISFIVFITTLAIATPFSIPNAANATPLLLPPTAFNKSTVSFAIPKTVSFKYVF